MSWRIGVDIGGTFTDVVLVDEATGISATTAVVDMARLHGLDQFRPGSVSQSGRVERSIGAHARAASQAMSGFYTRHGRVLLANGRLQAAIVAKAKRGELTFTLPAGLSWTSTARSNCIWIDACSRPSAWCSTS